MGTGFTSQCHCNPFSAPLPAAIVAFTGCDLGTDKPVPTRMRRRLAVESASAGADRLKRARFLAKNALLTN
jgi:hypothetical protein